LRLAGLTLGGGTPQVKSVVAGSVGEQAGLIQGDVITQIGAINNPDVGLVISTIQGSAGQPLLARIMRDGQPLEVSLVPASFTLDSGATVGRVGIQLGGDIAMVEVSYGPVDSVTKAVVRTFDTAWFSLRMMGKMLIGEVSWKNVSGPVTIADYAGQSARIGWSAYVAFLALVSVSLGVLNLLPIPMLDGGHLLYYLVEIVRGKPPSPKWVEMGQRAGFGLLASLMVLALFNDLMRIFT
jgi:regulator of sigma E protease